MNKAMQESEETHAQAYWNKTETSGIIEIFKTVLTEAYCFEANNPGTCNTLWLLICFRSQNL